MATKGGSKMFWIIGSLIVVAGSVGAYFLLRKPKEEKGADDTNTDTNSDEKQITETILGSDKKTYTAPSELNSTDKIKAFQDWMDAQGKGWVNKNGKWVLLNKGAGYGNYGKSTDAVWKVYGSEYLKSLKNPVTENKTDKPDAEDIKTILGYANGRTKKGLSTYPKDYIKDWANAIRKGLTTHTWSNQVYSTKNGQVLVKYNPRDYNHYITKKGQYFKETSSLNSKSYGTTIGVDLGKVGDVAQKFDSKGNSFLMYWIPSKQLWIYSNATSKTKPSSSFSGNEMDLDMFSTFDNNLDLNL